MCKPDSTAKRGSLHSLRDCNGNISIFSWQGEGWSTPGTHWETGWKMMQFLGWKYVGPEDGEGRV